MRDSVDQVGNARIQAEGDAPPRVTTKEISRQRNIDAILDGATTGAKPTFAFTPMPLSVLSSCFHSFVSIII